MYQFVLKQNTNIVEIVTDKFQCFHSKEKYGKIKQIKKQT